MELIDESHIRAADAPQEKPREQAPERVEVPGFADQAGHIPSARSLPAPWVWQPDGTYLELDTLAAMARGVIHQPKGAEVIVYCGVGGYAAVWWYVLTQVLGYQAVKFYDGAAQPSTLGGDIAQAFFYGGSQDNGSLVGPPTAIDSGRGRS